MDEPRVAGAIYDLGYQRYTGEKRGRGYTFRTLLAFSFKTALGIGRGEKARSVPLLTGLVVFLPALIQLGVASATNASNMITYGSYLEFTSVLLALFAAGQAPELIVTDRQQGTLALYLSRPLGSVDYALAKLLALTAAMLVYTTGPQLVLFVGKVFISPEPWPAFVAEWTKLFPILGGTMLVSVFFASIALSLSSLASRRGYASAGVIAFFLFAAAFSEMLRSVTFGSLQRYAVLGNPTQLMAGFAKWLFDIEARRTSAVARAALPGELYFYVMLGVSIAAILLLVHRFRRGEA